MLVKILRPVNNQHLAKLQAKKTVSFTLYAGALSCWKTKNSPDILSMADVNCFNAEFDSA